MGSTLRGHPTLLLGNGLTGRDQPAALSVKLCCTLPYVPLLLVDFTLCLETFLYILNWDRECESF